MIRATFERVVYNSHAADIGRLNLIDDETKKTVNINYQPNLTALDIHQKMLELCSRTSEKKVDPQGLENLIAYHKHCLEILERLK